MAMADYIACEACGGKAIYDGDWHLRDQEDITFAALCYSCAPKFKLCVEPLTDARATLSKEKTDE